MRILLAIISVLLLADGHAREHSLDTLYDWQLLAGDLPAQGVTVEQLAGQLADKEVIFVGEFHGHPAIHLFQMRLLQAMHGQDPSIILAMEQFSRDKQAVVDDYLAGKLGERTFRRSSRAWSNYTSDYRPLVEYAKRHQLPVIAANAPNWLVRCVGQKGADFLDQLPDSQRQWVAEELDLSDSPYKSRFLAYFAESNGAPSEALARRYAAQVSRDETMAESIVEQLERAPQRPVLLVAGNFHVAYHQGTVERVLRRRPQTRIAVIAAVAMPSQSQEPAGDIQLAVARLPIPYLANEARPADPHRVHSAPDSCQIPPQP